MPKKSLLAFLLCLLLTCPAPLATLAAESDMDGEVLAPAFAVFDLADPETFIYAKNPDRRIYPASTTKIMTCILAIELCGDLNEPVEVPDVATRLKSTNTLMGLKRGEVLPLIDLLYGMMLPSGNDAAIAVAYHFAEDVEQFAVLMNEKAAELGMENTNFVNASGVFKGQHYSTVRDMARLSAYAMQNETFRKIVSTGEYTVPANEARSNELHLVNTNRLISDPEDSKFYYEYAVGCKTGSTEKGGKCLVAAAEKDGVTLVAVLMGVLEGGGKSERIRRCFSDSKMMFETIYETMYATVTAEELGLSSYQAETTVAHSRLNDPADGLLQMIADFSGQSVTLPGEVIAALQADSSRTTAEITLPEAGVSAPVREGDVLGQVTLFYGDRVLFSGELLAARSVEAYDPADEPSPSPAPAASPSPAPQNPGPPNPGFLRYGLLALPVLLIAAILLALVRRRKQR